MKKISHIIWGFRWLQRIFSALLRRRDVIDLLPPIFAPRFRLIYDLRVRKIRSFRLRRQLSDYWAYDQCLAISALDLDHFPQGRKLRAIYNDMLAKGLKPIILDCGANIGFSAYWLAIEFPSAKIIAVEPEANNVIFAKFNTRHCNNVQILHGAVASTDSRITLTNTAQGSDAFRTVIDDEGEIIGYSISTIMTMVGGKPEDLLLAKIDIEGFEDELFSSNFDWVHNAHAIIVEPHDWMLPGQAVAKNLLQAISEKPRDFVVHGEHILSFRLQY